jgi:DNA-binding MarR family transcriptional regulator
MSLASVPDKSMAGATVPAGCWDLDLATGMLALCPQSRAMFGLSPESTDRLTESDWASRFHPQDLASVRDALTAGVEHQTPYAVRFRTIHPGGTVQVILGVGRPLDYGNKNIHFVGWNFDVMSTSEMAADWISAHPEALSAEHLFSVLPSSIEPERASLNELPSEALLTRAQAILRVRRARERLFCRAMIGEPAFDLLLCLYLRSGQKETSLTSLSRPAGIPNSSAARWIRYLADKGLVELTQSRSDRRATCIQLTSSGRSAMDEFLAIR